jgi:hypothetical protein
VVQLGEDTLLSGEAFADRAIARRAQDLDRGEAPDVASLGKMNDTHPHARAIS